MNTVADDLMALQGMRVQVRTRGLGERGVLGESARRDRAVNEGWRRRMSTKHCPKCGRDYPCDRDPKMSLLADTLEVSVFMVIQDLKTRSLDDIQAIARESAAVVAEHGDDLQFGGKHCASTHAALARGIAALSFAPGGVSAFGAHWCERHPESASAEGGAA